MNCRYFLCEKRREYCYIETVIDLFVPDLQLGLRKRAVFRPIRFPFSAYFRFNRSRLRPSPCLAKFNLTPALDSNCYRHSVQNTAVSSVILINYSIFYPAHWNPSQPSRCLARVPLISLSRFHPSRRLGVKYSTSLAPNHSPPSG